MIAYKADKTQETLRVSQRDKPAPQTMKLTDYVAQFIREQGVTHVFGLTGGAAVHLYDSVARTEGLTPVFCHHEQAGAFAAEGYARLMNSLGVCIVTTGPGGTNAVTGVTAAWLDSVPCLFISGQVRLAHTAQGHAVRQVGTQHLEIVPIVQSITKYAVMVEEPQSIRYHLEKAVWLARHGRPGPVWIDLPLDFHWATIEPSNLRGFDPAELEEKSTVITPESHRVMQCLELLSQAKRPLLVAGYGIRLARGEDEFRQAIEELRLPFLTTWNATDLLPTDHPLNIGRPGIFGQRGANLAIQNCDVLLVVGSHLCVSLTGTMFDAFARGAKIVMVDVDQGELTHRTVRVDLPIYADARLFLRQLRSAAAGRTFAGTADWQRHCQLYRDRHNAIAEEWRALPERVHSHVFVDELSRQLNEADRIVVDGGGTINQSVFQAFRTRRGQRLMISSGVCSMGSGLPESIGVAMGSQRARTICLSGDGSLQLNVQELQTIAHHQLPVKLFVLCNDGYTSIRQTQNGFLGGRHIGSEREGGLSLPDFGRVAQAYGLPTYAIHNHRELAQTIAAVLATPGPVVCQIMAAKDQPPLPRQGFDLQPDGTSRPRPLEDMFPYLPRDEFAQAMVVDPLPCSRTAP